MPEIVNDETVKAMIIDGLKEKYERQRVGVHLTDLICVRLTYFRKREGDSLSERDIVFYALGAGEGEVIEQLIGDKREVIVIKNGVVHTVDAITFVDDSFFPVEIKTTRTERVEKVDDVVRPHYLFQLGAYCSALSVSTGFLIVLMMNRGEVKVFKVNFSSEELENIEREVSRRRDLLLKALQEDDPTIAPSVLNDPDLNWKCNECRFREACVDAERGWRRFKFSSPLDIKRGFAKKLLDRLEKYKQKLELDYRIDYDGEKNVLAVSVKGTDRSIRDVKDLCQWINSKISKKG
ncbi:MAG: hypothetical protein QXV85_09920 [Candidatus Bathyarchaeia archaeon]